MSVTTGTVDFVVGQETFQTWYKVLGDLKSGIRPLVLLHGGPGIPHYYLTTHDELYNTYSIPLVWYDQLGCGSSTHLPDKPEAFWTDELFMDELENLVEHLGIAHDFALFGHSWGGMLASRLASTRHPAGLKRLILADTLASNALWDQSAETLLKGMPEGVQAVVKKHQEAGTFDDPEYEDAVKAYFSKHVCRVPWPDAFLKSLNEFGKEPTVGNIMCGPDEFHTLGTLRGWSVLDTIHTIAQPTLLINGRYDEAQDICMEPFFQKIPQVKWAQFSNSSHTPFFEEKERYFQIVSRFLLA